MDELRPGDRANSLRDEALQEILSEIEGSGAIPAAVVPAAGTGGAPSASEVEAEVAEAPAVVGRTAETSGTSPYSSQGRSRAGTAPLARQLAELQQVLEASFAQALAVTRACRRSLDEAGQPGPSKTSGPRPRALSCKSEADAATVIRVAPAKIADDCEAPVLDGDGGRPRACSFFRRQDDATDMEQKLLDKIPHYELHDHWLDWYKNDDGRPTRPSANRRRFLTLFSDDGGQDLTRNQSSLRPPTITAAAVRRALDISSWSAQTFMMRPSSLKRVTWDILSFLLVGYDSFMVPFQLADPPPSDFFGVMLWITRVFWTIDIVVTCFTGYTDNKGAIVMSPREVVRRYLRTWFLFDIFVVGLDWTELILSSGAISMSWARVGKATRFFRIARMLRLLRLARVQDTASTQIAMFLENLQNERLSLMMDIIKMTVMLAGIAHVLACLWCGLGSSPPDGARSWLTEEEFVEASFGRRYTVALHWALTQFQGGMDEVRPHNINERIYAVCALLLGFLVATAVLGRLTSSMTQLYVLSSHNSRKVSALRTYLKQNAISRRLAFRIHRNALHAIAANESIIQEQSVELLAIVSEPLRAELHFELYSPCFGEHGLFSNIIGDYPEVMSRVCHQALSIMEMSSGDPVFHNGERPTHPRTYIVSRGELQYVVGVSGTAHSVEPGNFVSEAVLWTDWTHCGLLVCTTEAQLTVLVAEEFIKIVLAFSLPWTNAASDPRQYAAHFVSTMNDMLLQEEDINDLFTVGAESDAVSGSWRPAELQENLWVVRPPQPTLIGTLRDRVSRLLESGGPTPAAGSGEGGAPPERRRRGSGIALVTRGGVRQVAPVSGH